ncbi:hypothetical protein Q5P01_006588 [Channa striata]|uniref:Uncharacterized protein n=1 Tax=Channa striata TaxID=64152 RepID=A0AA88N895_CHASR|nr:hypothetical protein Q5P01_006588 [Channa striata]
MVYLQQMLHDCRNEALSPERKDGRQQQQCCKEQTWPMSSDQVFGGDNQSSHGWFCLISMFQYPGQGTLTLIDRFSQLWAPAATVPYRNKAMPPNPPPHYIPPPCHASLLYPPPILSL